MNENTGTFEMRRVGAEADSEVRLTMQSLWLSGRILPVGARLIAVHTFRSAETEPVEVVYSFGLPRDAALRRFRIVGPGFQARSELRPVEAAQKTYEAAIQSGHLASLARTYRDGRVNLSVGNLRPGEEVRVWLELVAGVELQDDGFRFRFPFALAPCYHAEARMVEVEPGAGEMELPGDRFDDVLLPRWLSDERKLHRVGFDLEVAWPGKPEEVGSPSHGIRVGGATAGGVRVCSSRGSDVPNRDLVLEVRDRKWKGGVYGGVLGERGRCATVVIPSTVFGAGEKATRSVVFLLDRSGSMGGEPLEQAKRGLRACLGALGPEDRFGLVVFDSAPEAFRPGLQRATPPVRQDVMAFLDGVQAQNGTELVAGVRAAVQVLGKQGGDVFVLTDGQVAETEAILSAARAAGARLHCLGIGSASQDRFLTLLARETGGSSRFVTARERVDLEAVGLFAGVGRPVAEEVTVRLVGAEGGRVVVAPPQRVHAGQPWIGMFEAPSRQAGAIEVHWRTGGEGRAWKSEWPEQATATADTVWLLQGARCITDLEARLEAEPGTSSASVRGVRRQRAELAASGQKYGLANRELSLVAVIERADADASRAPKTMVVPVGLPEDLEHAAYFGTPSSLARLTERAHRFAPRSSKRNTRRDVLTEPDVRYMACSLMSPLAAYAPPTPELAEAGAGWAGTERDTILLEQAAAIEPDGGLPGPDLGARVLRTLLFLCCLLTENQTCHRGLFRQHVQRLVQYLDDPSRLPPEPARRRLVEYVVSRATHDQPFGMDKLTWAPLELTAASPPRALWKRLERELRPDVQAGLAQA